MLDGAANPSSEISDEIASLPASMKEILVDEVADVRTSERLTESAFCLVASDKGADRHFQRLLSAAGRIDSAAKPVQQIY